MLGSRQITPPNWMTDPRAEKIMRVLGAFEVPLQTLFVGGCVRNALLDLPVTDVDIATIHHPLVVIDRLKTAGIRFIPTGLDHGTVTAVVETMSFEITTLRKDMATDGRHAVIAFTDDWREDALRRDFTINTLLADVNGAIYDPTGQGLFDLDLRKVRFVGNADDRIAEDYLRILRFFRFHARYGEDEPDVEALVACQRQADKVSLLSKERTTQEFLKILGGPQTGTILELMFSRGVLMRLSEHYKRSVMDDLVAFQVRFDAEDILTRLGILGGNGQSQLFQSTFVLSNAQKKYLQELNKNQAAMTSLAVKKIRELVYRFGNHITLQSYFLKLAQEERMPDLDLIDVIRYWQPPSFPITGDDLIAAGIMRGPALGERLKTLEEKWIKSDFTKLPKI